MAENHESSDEKMDNNSDSEVEVWSDSELHDADEARYNKDDILGEESAQLSHVVESDNDDAQMFDEISDPLDFVDFKGKVQCDVAPRFGLTGTAYSFSFKNKENVTDAQAVAQTALDKVLEDAFSDAGEKDLVGVSIKHPSLEHEILVHFGKKQETTSDKVLQTVGAVQQSKKDLEFDETMTVKITRITPPEGRGYRKFAKGKFGEFFKKYSGGQGATFIEIKNKDWMCFARAVVVAKARYQYHVQGDKSVPFKTVARGDENKCTMQRILALELMTRAGLLGQKKRSCGIEEFKKIQKVIQEDGFQMKVFSHEHFDALIFDEELPDLVPLYIYHHDDHYTPMSSPKILTGSKFFCDLCNQGYNRLHTHRCAYRCPCCKSKGRCPRENEWITCELCKRRFGSMVCFDNHQKRPDTFRTTEKNKRVKVLGHSICMKLKRCLECGRCVSNGQLPPSKHNCGMNYCSTCRIYWKIGEIHECFMQPIKGKKQKSSDEDTELLPEEGQDDPDDIDALVREEEDRQGETEQSRQAHFKKDSDKGPTKYLFWDFETVQCHENKEKFITIGMKQYSLGPIYHHSPNYCVVRKACMNCKDFWLSRCEDPKCKAHSCPKCQSKPACQFCAEHYKVFEGDNCRNDFCDYLFSAAHRGITAIAHNAKGFDAQFIMQWLAENKMIPKVIPRGLSILSLKVMGIRVIDSFAFLPQSLESLPKTFNEPELKKGYFPYLFNKPENYGYVGPYPDADQYCPSQMKPDARKKFYQWYNENKTNIFDFKKELKEYTESDVDILLRCLLKFNDLFNDATGVYPLEIAITIAQACNYVFKRNYLLPNTIGVVPTGGYRGKEKQSLEALEWLHWMSHKTGTHIQHARNGREKIIGRYKVDGYIQKDKTVLEYNGCVFHGCRRCFKDRDKKVPNSTLTYEEVYQKTLEKAEFIKTQGFNLIQIWGCEWNEEKFANNHISDYLKTLKPEEIIDGRAGLAGGRTNATVLWKKCKLGEKICYYDVCSLYPFICKYGVFPLKHPEIITENFECITAKKNPYFGIIRCKVLAPRKLLHPVLPYKYNMRLNFPLCRLCLEMQNQEICQHADDDRSFVGTFVSLELNKALQVGYKVMETYEVWHYKEKMEYNKKEENSGFFTAYVNKFLKIKQEKSGWPNWVKTQEQKDQYINEYEKKEGIKLDAAQIEKNPGLQAVAKLMLNSFWGKFAQKNDMSTLEFFNEPNTFFKAVFDNENIISSVRGLGPDMVAVTYKKDPLQQAPNPNTSVVLASFVTAQARLKLYSYLEKLQDRVLYFDTDSVIFVKRESDIYMPKTGDYLGDLTNELSEFGEDAYISEFLSCGPKQYSFQVVDKSGKIVKTVTKVKGFSLNYATSNHINHKTMKTQVQTFVELGQQNSKKITIYNPMIKRTKTHQLTTEILRKEQKVVYCKRVVKPDYSSVPYGY